MSIALLGVTVSAAPPAGSAPADRAHAVVIVSGGAATSPFTTPDAGCASGLAAGNTDTAIRRHLVDQGHEVYTSPAMAGRGRVTDQTGFGPFGDCPITLPEIMTVDSTGSIDTAGEHLARFLNYLDTERGVDQIDLVAHSMGGLYSRAAIKVLQSTGAPMRIRSLTTLGTPWQGSFLSDYAGDTIGLDACLGDQFCEQSMEGFRDEVVRRVSGSGREVSRAYLMGPQGWNAAQAGVLDGIPVVLVGGDAFARPGPVDPAVWPNDGIVALRSALAMDVDDAVLPHRRCATVDDAHSIYVASLKAMPETSALTWDPRVFALVDEALATAPEALGTPNRVGC
ncbi:lipase family alpha/beta hydrolase [Mycolicibacterium sediminis]|uniref:lipase family alpha/beta hydrolase n=1 Tax=Mycolicibacterium sediminis TaxID=1286180 RepID=UPI0027E325BE|nr:alpha/beta hydrolase [Mycolicibacterium sediminis]